MRIILESVADQRRAPFGSFDGEVVRLGAGPGNDLVLPAGDGFGADAAQAEICVESAERIVLFAVSRTVPTRLNARTLSPGDSAPLRNGDEIRFGSGSRALRFSFQPETVSEIFPAGQAPAVGPRTLRELVGAALEAGRKAKHGRTVTFARTLLDQAGKANRRLRLWLGVLGAVSLLTLVGAAATVAWLVGRVERVEARDLRVDRVRERHQARIVLIRTHWSYTSPATGATRSGTEFGSGFLLDDRGTVLTAKHVVEPWKYRGSYPEDDRTAPGRQVESVHSVWLPQPIADGSTSSVRVSVDFDPESPTAPARLERSAEDVADRDGFHRSTTIADLALLRLETPPEPGAAPAIALATRVPRPGVEPVVVLGYPRASQFQRTRLPPTIAPDPLRNVDDSFLHLGGTVQPGLSGAPVFDAEGDLLGVVVAQFASETGMGCAIRAEHVRRFLEGK